MESAKKKQFRELRKIAGWSPAETARQLGCSRAHVSNIENPDMPTQPGPRLLDDFRQIIGLSGSGTSYPAPASEGLVLQDSPEVQAATNLLLQIPHSF